MTNTTGRPVNLTYVGRTYDRLLRQFGILPEELNYKLKQLMSKQALWEAIKEPLRLLAIAVIPLSITYLLSLPYEWAAVAIAILRFVDKLLHEIGKESENESLTKGLTRF